MALTKKQKLFIKEYLKDLNATKAAERAGYSKNTAYAIGFENLKKPKIAERIQKEMDKRSERIELDADNILEGILDIRDTAMKKIVIERDVDGEKYYMEKMVDANNALKASELLGKHLKLFTDKIEHSGNIDVVDRQKLIEKYLNDE